MEATKMFPEDLFAFVLEQLADEVGSAKSPYAKPLETNSFLARSVMQKAIRRGMTDLALSAAATLIQIDRRTLWRRLIVTALEDLGVGEVDLTARIIAASRDRSWRQTVGGEWAVISTWIVQACDGSCDQSSNDLWNIARTDPGLDDFKASLGEADLPDLLRIMTDPNEPPEHRGVAVLIVLGEDAGPAPTHIDPDPGSIFAAFTGAGHYSHVAAVYEAAYRQSRLALAPLALCLWTDSRSVQVAGMNDDLPPVCWIGELPSFALDQYTRPGKEAIRRFAYSSPIWRDFALKWDITRSQWAQAVGEVIFRAEGARVTNRRAWEVGGRLYARSAVLDCYMPQAAVPEALALIRRELPQIDHFRSAALAQAGGN